MHGMKVIIFVDSYNKPQRSGQPQNSKICTKNREITIAMYLCKIYLIILKKIDRLPTMIHGEMVSTFAFKCEGHDFESRPGQIFFYFFSPK